MDWVNAIVQGTLLGGLYALFAAGLSLIFGVMRLVNIAHGDLIVLAAYLGLSTTMLLGVHPFVALIVVLPLMAGIGYALQRGVLNQTLGPDILPPLLVTFGLSVILQNALLEGYTADPQKLNGGAIETASLSVGGLAVGVLPLLTFAVAVAVIASPSETPAGRTTLMFPSPPASVATPVKPRKRSPSPCPDASTFFRRNGSSWGPIGP